MHIHRYDPETAAIKIVNEIQRRPQDKSKHFLIALDGRSGTGKSTIARLIAEKINSVIVVSDDFYAGGNDDKWKGYTPQEKANQVIDWKKMRIEVLEPLKKGKTAFWHPLDFEPGKGWVGWKKELMSLNPAEIIILDGAYSTRPELSDLVDLTVLIEATEEIRRKRLQEREGDEFIGKWHSLWDQAEDYYFTQIRPKSSFDLVISLM